MTQGRRGRRRTDYLVRGFDSLTLDPSPRMRRLRREIATRNVVAEAWEQTGAVLASSMTPSTASRPNSKSE